FNDELHTARNVTKTHKSNTKTFQSPNHGPIGVLTKYRLQFHHMPYRQQELENVNDKLNVQLVKAYMGIPGDIFSFYNREGTDGTVIEALGQGNIPPSAIEGNQQLESFNIPIVLVSRSFTGIVSPTYPYDG
ncbi:asparaginase domain-containing protein, partial [Staphylococcus aureus]|uniref:asparaginase domain-containing protein n=1 Tax=Staphylococcus aureus TaxID=1280 RepID=UPI00210B85B5